GRLRSTLDWFCHIWLEKSPSTFVSSGSSVKVFSRPGQLVTLPCSYQYESRTNISQLSVQWRSPANELLCHYIKHKSFQNCSTGYTIHYRPGNISLIIQQVQTKDIGTHICSVSKRHEFSDFSVDLDGRAGGRGWWVICGA
uniref:Ig-like domain-containing protein n=1 Tax=Nothobranchius furzeri TaxID=105023 RepID=A0A8C6L1P9_NOTFU